MRRLVCSSLLFLCCISGVGAEAATLPIKASANGRYLVDSNGVPWLMVGDSAHTAICKLRTSNWPAYLADRQSKGFNTIDVLVLDAAASCAFPSTGAAADNTLPFTSGSAMSSYDISTPNPAYWSQVDSFISQAAALGLVVSIDPMAWGNGFRVTYRNNGTAKLFNFGVFLGNRYKNSPNIIWHMGQDFDGNTFPAASDLNLMAQLMAGIRSVDTNHLVNCQLNFHTSYSNQGSSTNATYAANLTSDFVYTYQETYDYMLRAYNSSPVLPVFLGEANYEGGNNTLGLPSPAGPLVLRMQDYWTITSGGLAGFIWGNESVNHFDSSYPGSLNTTGTSEVKYVQQLLSQYKWWNLVPDQTHSIVTAGFGAVNTSNNNLTTATYATTSWSADGSLAITYAPVSTTLTVDMAKFSGLVTASWYDPSNGTFRSIAGSPFVNSASQNFATPGTNGDGAKDWVLVLSSAVAAPAPPTNLKAVVQ
jgi:hypothetical protein